MNHSLKNPDFLIIGGGILGCAIAWNLARRSKSKVLLLERQELATATTSKAAGLIRKISGKKEQIPLRQLTVEAIDLLSEELNEPLPWNQSGGLLVAESSSSLSNLVDLQKLAIAHDEKFEWIERSEAEDLVPWLNVDSTKKIALLPNDGWIDPYLLSTFYANAAKKHGAEFRMGVEVKSLQKSGQKIIGVNTDNGNITAGCVIDAAGPWAGLVALETGWHLPMAPVRSHYWITSKNEKFQNNQPYVILPDANAYTRPEVGGLLFGLRDKMSLSHDPRKLPNDFTELKYNEDPLGWHVLEEQGEGLARFFPGLESMHIAHYIAGPSTYTPDGQFLLGTIPEIEGFLVASGCCGSGIGASGGIGKVISDLACDGTTTLEIDNFRTDRFGPIDSFSPEWINRCVKARFAKK